MNPTQFKGRGHPVHGFGYKPDPAGHRYNGFHLHPVSKLRADALPNFTNNIASAPPVWDQGQTGSCTGHGTACIITTYLAGQGRPLNTPADPRYIYTIGRAIDRENTSQPLQDEGAYPNSVVRALGLWGLVVEDENDGGRTAESPDYTRYLEAHVNDEPKLLELELGQNRLIFGFNSISDNDSNKLLKFRQALAGGYPVGVAVEAGNSTFQGFNGQGVLDYCGDQPDHWVAIIDYRTNSAGKFEFLLQNSWGYSWTPSGRAWVTSNFVTKGCFDSLVCNLGA